MQAAEGKNQQKKGKGWFGDSKGHAKAGSKGGKARGTKYNNRKNNNNSL